MISSAEIIAVGTELLLGHGIDTNSAYIGEHLAALGINLYQKQVIGDNESRLIEAIKTALSRTDLLVTIGGLGPTVDDMTRPAICKALGLELIMNDEIATDIRQKFARRKLEMSENNLLQAYVPEGAEYLTNSRGTAPGLIVEKDGRTVIALPGPPRELIKMFEDDVLPWLKENSGTKRIFYSRVLKLFGLPESEVDERIADLQAKQENPTIGILAKRGEISIRLTAAAESGEEARKLIAGPEKEILSRFPKEIFGYDEDDMESVVAGLLKKKKLTVSTAESCTGGLLSGRLTAIPGSTAYFIQGVTTYANEAKIRLLGVPAEMIREEGAVSGDVASQMARNCRERAFTNLAVAITGVAGPDGGTEEKPVGLVYIALADDQTVYCTENRLSGDREYIRFRSTQIALNMIRLYCIGELL